MNNHPSEYFNETLINESSQNTSINSNKNYLSLVNIESNNNYDVKNNSHVEYNYLPLSKENSENNDLNSVINNIKNLLYY